MTEIQYTLIDTQAGLKELAAVLADEPWHALDTEANSGFVYRERLCLLQFNVGSRLWLVDLTEFPKRDALEALRGPFESAEQVTYLHGGEFDVGCMKRDFDIHLEGVWDSQQAATFLGWEKTGYGAVVERICGVTLEKAYAHYDWGRRPLPEEPLRYALDDVVYLPEVCEGLMKEVAEADLEEEVAIAHRAVMDATWSGEFHPDGFWRVKGARRLPPDSARLLRDIYCWREGVAEELDSPPGRVINNRLLLAMAKNPPKDRRALGRMGIRGELRSQYGDDLVAEILESLAAKDVVKPPVSGRVADRSEFSRFDRLRDWRRAECERRKVPPQVVLPPRALEFLKQSAEPDLEAAPQLGAKRIRMYGEELLKVCRG